MVGRVFFSRILALIAVMLALTAGGFAQDAASDAETKYSMTFNHAVEQGDDPKPEPVVLAHIDERLPADGAFAFYRAADVTERSFILQSREKLDVGKRYKLTGRVESAENHPQFKQPVFVVTEVEQLGNLTTWLLVGGLVLLVAGSVWLYSHRMRGLYKDAVSVKSRQEGKLDLGRKATEYHPVPAGGAGVDVSSMDPGFLIDFGYHGRMGTMDLGYDRRHSVLERRFVNDRVTIYQVSRQSAQVQPNEKTPHGYEIAFQKRIEEPEGAKPALSRKGSFILMATEDGSTYVMPSPEAANPVTVLRENRNPVLPTASSPFLLEDGDQIKIGHMTFSYKAGSMAHV